MFFGENNHWKINLENSFFGLPKRSLYLFKLPSILGKNRGLPKEFNPSQSPIQNFVEKERRKTERLNTRTGIKSVLSGMEREEKMAAVEVIYQQLNQPIVSSDQFKEATVDVGSYAELREKIYANTLRQEDLLDLKEKGIATFFDGYLQKKINQAEESSLQRIKTDSVLGIIENKYKAKAEEDWFVFSGQLVEEKNKLENEKVDLENVDTKEEVDTRLAEIENDLLEIEKQLEAKADWIKQKSLRYQAEEDIRQSVQSGEVVDQEKRIRGRVIELERPKSEVVSSILDPQSKEQIVNILLNAEFLRKQQVKKYLQKRQQEIADQFAELAAKQPSHLEDNEGYEAQNKIATLGKILSDSRILKSNPSDYEDLNRKLDHVASVVSDLGKERDFVKKYAEDKEAFKANLKIQLDNIKAHQASFGANKSDEFIEEELRKLDEKEQKRIREIKGKRHPKYDVFGQSPAYLQAREKILSMKNGGGFNEMVDTLSSQIENFDNLSVQDQKELMGNLDSINEKLGSKYPVMLKALKDTSNINEVQGVLDQFLGEKHVEYVDHHTFTHYGPNQKNLQDYTMKGGMVFYQKGDEWKIVIDKSRMDEDVDFLKKQIDHEIKHVWFENDKSLQNKWHKTFVESADWPNIKKAFIDTFPEKSAPTNEGWQDEDVLHELFAMQDDLIFQDPNKNSFEKDSPADRLNKGIWQARQEESGIAEMIRGHDDADDAAGIMQKAAAGEDGEGGDTAVEGAGSAKVYREQIKKADETIKGLIESSYTNHLPGANDLLSSMKAYNAETATLNEEYDKTASEFLGLTVKDRLKMTEENLKKLNKMVADIGDQIPDEGGNHIRDLWNRTHWFSAQDFWQVGVDVMDWWKRRHNRKKGDAAARIGTAVADKMPLPWVGEYGMEAQARKEKTEAEEVDEWKNRLGNKDAWELNGLIEQMSRQVVPNPDQLKAILRILADKGRIDWRKPELWTLLSKLQTAVTLDPDDEVLLKNPVLLKQRLHQAIGNIYDYDEYLDLERSNEDHYQGGKDKYAATLDKIQDQVGDRLKQLFRKHKNEEQVDPQEFEGILEYCIKNGKYSAEGVMYFLMMGMAEGLLPPDRGLSLDKFLNKWPATQWIYSKKPPLTKKDYIYYANTYFPDSVEAGEPKEDFDDFYWTLVQNDPMTIQRVRKSVSERDWDHDWGRAVACMGDANTAKRFLQGRSSQQEAKDTAVENSYVGAWMWLQKNAKHRDRINARQEFARQAAWTAMADGIMSHVAYYNGASDTYTRGNASMMNAHPREGGMAGDAQAAWTTSKFRDGIHAFFDQIDGQFFRMIRNEVDAKNDREGMGQRVRDYLINRYPGLASEAASITNIDHVYDKMDAIVQHMINNMSDEAFTGALNRVQSFHTTGA